MINKVSKNVNRQKRHLRLRQTLSGTATKPRLNVFRSNKQIYAQIIDDVAQNTICAASTMEADIASKVAHTSTVEAAKVVGEAIAKKAMDKGIKEVVFDRGGFVYHGKIQALADAAREAGLQF